MNLEAWKLIAAIGGVLVTVVTGPIIWAVRAELGKLRAEFKGEIAGSEFRLDKRIAGLESHLEARITAVESRLDARITAVESNLEKKMIEMESRLNTRIDTRLVHR